MRLAVIATHPVQYYAPLFRKLAEHTELTVFYGHMPSAAEQGRSFGTAFTWDVDLTSGYNHELLKNLSKHPDVSSQFGLDTPDIGKRLAAGHFDVVLVLGWYTRSLRQGIRAARNLGLPVMVRGDSQPMFSGSRLRNMAKSLSYPIFLRAFSAVLYVGTRSRQFFERYHYPKKQMFYAPHAVDTKRFAMTGTAKAGTGFRSRNEIDPDETVVLFAGKLLGYKRPLIAVEAVAHLRQTGLNARLVIAGTGPLEDAIVAQATAHGVPLTRLGFVNQSEMPPVYAAANVLVLPSSRRETWGLVANEALACGTPVVVSDEAGCAPDLCDGQAGMSCMGADPADVAAALAAILSAPPNTTAIRERSDAHSLDCATAGIVKAASAVVN